MAKPISQRVFALYALVLASAAAESHAITQAEGRAIFAQQGCAECHAYVGQIGASSAKQMSRRFGGEVDKAFAAYYSAAGHAIVPGLAKVPHETIRLISEWLAGGPAAPTAVLPQPPIAAAAPGEAALPASGGRKASDSDGKNELAARALRKKEEAEAAAKLDAELRAAQKRETQERAKQAAADRAKRAAEERAALKRDSDERVKLAAEAKAKRELEALATQKREAEEHAKRVAEAKAKNDLDAQTALKREADERAKRAGEAKAKRDAEEQAAAKREAEELAKRTAEARARREAEEQAALRREADERSRREADLKARQEAEARAKREAESRAKKDADAQAAKREAEGKVAAQDDGESRGKGKGGKAPEKFRDEACPPIAASAPIGVVDEERAKQIMERVDCGSCHAFVQKKTGPPMKRIHEKVKGNPECVIQRLKKNKEHNEEGVTDEIKGPEFKIVADYLATRAK